MSSSAPAVRLTSFPQRALVPAEEVPDDVVGPMFSGAFVYSDDPCWESLTNGSGPVPLHDRFETIGDHD